MHSASFCKRMVFYTESRRLFFEFAVSSTLLMKQGKMHCGQACFFKLGSIPTWLGWCTMEIETRRKNSGYSVF